MTYLVHSLEQQKIKETINDLSKQQLWDSSSGASTDGGQPTLHELVA